MHRTSALKSILHFWRSFGSRRRRAEAGRGGVGDGGDGAPAATAAAGASDRPDFGCCLGPAGGGCRGGASGRGHECLRWCNAGGGHDGGILEGGRATTASRFQAWWQLTVFCWHWGRAGGAAARTRLRLTSSPSEVTRRWTLLGRAANCGLPRRTHGGQRCAHCRATGGRGRLDAAVTQHYRSTILQGQQERLVDPKR